MSKGNGRIVEPGVPSIHDPEYQEILKHKKKLCNNLRDHGVMVSDIDEYSHIINAVVTDIKSLFLERESYYVEDEDLTEKTIKSLNKIETACLGCDNSIGEQVILKEKFLNTVDDIIKDMATIKKHMT